MDLLDDLFITDAAKPSQLVAQFLGDTCSNQQRFETEEQSLVLYEGAVNYHFEGPRYVDASGSYTLKSFRTEDIAHLEDIPTWDEIIDRAGSSAQDDENSRMENLKTSAGRYDLLGKEVDRDEMQRFLHEELDLLHNLPYIMRELESMSIEQILWLGSCAKKLPQSIPWEDSMGAIFAMTSYSCQPGFSLAQTLAKLIEGPTVGKRTIYSIDLKTRLFFQELEFVEEDELAKLILSAQLYDDIKLYQRLIECRNELLSCTYNN